MRVLGIVLLVAALAALGRSLFALAWDGGTNRVNLDLVLLAISLLLAIGASGLIAGKGWGRTLTAASLVLAAVLVAMATLARGRQQASADAVAPSTLLQQLPADAPSLAARLDATWWATDVATLRERERTDNAIARDWQIQGDSRARLLATSDLAGATGDDGFALRVFLLIEVGGRTVAVDVGDGFVSADRDAPVELVLSGHEAQVLLRGNAGCRAFSYRLDYAGGNIAALGEAGC